MRGYHYTAGPGTGFGSALPAGIKYLIMITTAVYILQMIPGFGSFILDLRRGGSVPFFGFGPLVPEAVFRHGHIWRLVTYLFLHGGAFHLFFNMLALWMFGTEIERMWGTKRFLVFYFIAGTASGLLSYFMASNVPIIGASGSVLAILTIYAFYFPNRKVLMFFIFPVPVWAAVAIIGFISLSMARTSAGGVAHLIHLGGIITAFVYIKSYDRLLRFFRGIKEIKREKDSRKNVHEYINRQRYYEEVIDPLLKKVSKEGMNSLTEEEKKILRNASEKKNKQNR